MLPRENVLYSYVVEDEDKQITDFISFYSLPSSILEHPDYETLHCAYLYYYFTGKYDITELQRNVLVIANKMKYDVFNALDIFENRQFFEELKFTEGDGQLHYYFYNWRVNTLASSEIGVPLI